MDYESFIADKSIRNIDAGFVPDESRYPDAMFPHQSVSVTWACKRGRAGIFFDTGLGKTLAQLTWADQVREETQGNVLILAPLAVTRQTCREGDRFGIPCTYVEYQDDIYGPGIYVTNYEKIHHFDCSTFSGVVLDESSILKGMDGKMRRLITDSFAATPYKLSCTATPSPNDFMELGTQSEFLGIMTQIEMLAMFFVHDGSDTSKWRLKGHGKSKFWEWLATWSIFITSPSDLGFDSTGYDLPAIEYHEHVLETIPTDGLFADVAQSLTERNKARRDSLHDRCKLAADIVNRLDEPAIIWCHLNDESQMLSVLIADSVEVKGSDKSKHKENALLGFSDGKIKALVTKPKIAGFGMNWQNSRHCVFVGLSDSWESFYQAIRRQWRFGQTKTVHVHVISADTEGAVVANIKRKDQQHKEMSDAMMEHMRDLVQKNVLGATIEKTDYLPCVDMLIPDYIHTQP